MHSREVFICFFPVCYRRCSPDDNLVVAFFYSLPRHVYMNIRTAVSSELGHYVPINQVLARAVSSYRVPVLIQFTRFVRIVRFFHDLGQASPGCPSAPVP